MAASRSASSWNRHVSAIKCFSKYCLLHGIIQSWPIDLKTLRSFVNWVLTNRKLSCNSARVYLSDLKLAHNLRGLETKIFNDFFIKTMLKGAENLALYENISKRARLIMTLPLLKILGHEIAKSSWSSDSKRVFWSACCFRILPNVRNSNVFRKAVLRRTPFLESSLVLYLGLCNNSYWSSKNKQILVRRLYRYLQNCK
jgi:hypothetical protein